MQEPFRLGAWRIDPGLCKIVDGDRVGRVEPRAMAVLCHLATRAGETVTRDELLDAVWGNRFVVEEAVSRCISQLRQALGDDPREPRYIQTVPKVGYRLLVEPQPERPANAAAAAPEPAKTPGRRLRLPLLAGLSVLLLAAAGVFLSQRSPTLPEPSVAPPPLRSVAVLPFAAIGADGRDALLADGMTEEIIHLLATVPGLHVTSRTSSFHFKGRDASVATIGRELGVAHVLEGSVRAEGDRIRVTAQLIDVSSDVHIWSQAFEGELAGFLDVQKRIAVAVARRLDRSVDSRLVDGAPATRDVAAYQLFVEGWLALERYEQRSLRHSIALFEAALERDAAFASAWSGLAMARWVMPSVVDLTPAAIAESDRLALDAANRALELSSLVTSARFVLADSARVKHDFAEAEARFRAALEVVPGEAVMHFGYAQLLGNVGRIRDSLAPAQVNVLLDPLSPIGMWTLGQSHVLLGDDEEARRYLARSRELGNENPVIAQAEAYLHLRAGSFDAARALWADLHDSAESQAMLRVIDALEDPSMRPSALEAIGELPPWHIHPFRGRLYAAILLGEAEMAWQAAADGVELGLDPTVTWWMPEASILRTDSRFAALAARLNLLPYWREYGWPDACRESRAELTCR